MIRFSLSLFIAAIFAAAVQQAMAATYVVGTCKPKFKSYSTISAAVSSVPAGSHVVVCPGTYPEQVSITQPLSLEGISSSNSGRAIITVPGEVQGNPQLQVNSYFGLLGVQVAAQLLVQAESVIISNITVDGTGVDGGNCLNGGVAVFGIFYSSGSSGTLLRATTRHQQSSGCGIGIVVENESGTAESVTVRDSSVHDTDIGIETGTLGDPLTLSTMVAGNFVSNVSNAIQLFSNSATATANFVTSSVEMQGQGSSVLLSSNELADDYNGIVLSEGATAKGNAISNSGYALELASGAAAQSNQIMNASQDAIIFSCDVGSASGNIVNDASVGLAQADHASLSGNHFYNVDTIQTTCF